MFLYCLPTIAGRTSTPISYPSTIELSNSLTIARNWRLMRFRTVACFDTFVLILNPNRVYWRFVCATFKTIIGERTSRPLVCNRFQSEADVIRRFSRNMRYRVNTFLPLLRRRAKIRRPPLVLERFLNPCTRFFCLIFG